MARWADVAESDPGFAARAEQLFNVHKHRVLATLRRDGFPRVSGTEMYFVDGDVWFGSMLGARKARDLQRDPRFALHGPMVDPGADWQGDAKLTGRAEEVSRPEIRLQINQLAGGGETDLGDYHLFRADISEVVVTMVDGEFLRIERWRPDGGVRSFRRK